MKLKITFFSCMVLDAMYSVCCCSLPASRSLPKKGTLLDLFFPTMEPLVGGSDPKTTTLVRDHEYYIPPDMTEFRQNPSISEVSVENVSSLADRRRTTDNARSQKVTGAFGSCALIKI